MATPESKSTNAPLPRVMACKPLPDYTLWLRFSDGIEGTVDLGNLLDIGAFRLWRDVRRFLEARAEPQSCAIVWPAGVRLDTDVLRWDILARSGCIDASEAARVVRGVLKRDAAFQRFMRRVRAPLKRQRRRK
jgi:hypothetical protein